MLKIFSYALVHILLLYNVTTIRWLSLLLLFSCKISTFQISSLSNLRVILLASSFFLYSTIFKQHSYNVNILFQCMYLEFLHFSVVHVHLEVFASVRTTKDLPQTEFHCKRRTVLTTIMSFLRAEDTYRTLIDFL